MSAQPGQGSELAARSRVIVRRSIGSPILFMCVGEHVGRDDEELS